MGEGQLWPQLILTLKKRLLLRSFSLLLYYIVQFSFYEKKIENTLVARGGGVLITKAAERRQRSSGNFYHHHSTKVLDDKTPASPASSSNWKWKPPFDSNALADKRVELHRKRIWKPRSNQKFLMWLSLNYSNDNNAFRLRRWRRRWGETEAILESCVIISRRFLGACNAVVN